jgi:hypothetical protein
MFEIRHTKPNMAREGPGAYFKDETIWRGKLIAAIHDLKMALYLLGLLIGLLYFAIALASGEEKYVAYPPQR